MNPQPQKRKVRVELSFVPRTHQREANRLRKRFSVLVWHRRSGKTVFAIIELILAAVFAKLPNSRYAYIAPLYGQAKAVAWEYLKRFATEIPGVIVKEGELTIVFPNGSAIRIFGADNPNNLRGLYFDGVVLDEVADMKPQVWGEIVRPALSDRLGWALFIGTPKGLNLFSELYYAALSDAEWYADMKRVGDTTSLLPAEIESARRSMSPQQFAQEYECDFAAGIANAMIPLESGLQAYGKKIALDSFYYAPRILGVDVARYGDDRSVIFPRQGLAAQLPQIFTKLSTMELANHILNKIVDWQPDAVFIDDDGVGGGVTDRLRQLGRMEIIPVKGGAKATNPLYSNLRVEMWAKMKAWIDDGGCLPEQKGLLEDLCGPTYWYGDNGKMHLEATEDIKKRLGLSPDLAMGLCYTFAAPVVKAPETTRYVKQQNKVQTEYDVLG
jgi:hypothetical protein